jgi:hypothetical protein
MVGASASAGKPIMIKTESRGFQALLSLCLLALAAEAVGVEPSAAPIIAGPAGPLRNIGGVGYVAPEGWQVRETNGVVLMLGPVEQQYQPCLIAIDPTVPPAPDLTLQAEAIVNSAFGRQYGLYRSENGGDVKADQYLGVAAAGWPYVDLMGHLGNSRFYVRAVLARFGQRAVAVVGLSSTQDCLGSLYLRDNDVFLLVFHSLQLPGYSANPQEAGELRKALIGEWQSVSGSAGLQLTYAANGHFSDIGVAATYYRSAGGVIYETSSAWPGDGTYQVAGDRLTTVHSAGANVGVPVTRLFSIVHRPKRGQPGQYDDILRIVEHSTNGRTWGFGNSSNYVISNTKIK